MNRTIGFFAGCVVLLASFAAQAQTPSPQLKMDTGFYVGLGVGRAEVREFCTTVSGQCDSKDQTWNLYLGYQVNRFFAVEAGYTDLGDATVSGVIAGVGPASLRMSNKAWEIVGVGLLPLPNSNFAFFGKLGAIRYKSSLVGGGAFVGAVDDNGTELTGGVGVQYSFTRELAGRLEWQRYYNLGGGNIGIRPDVNALRLGARYKF
jgi:OOP family OmpA-OmpF porin